MGCFPGVVFNFTAPIQGYGEIAFDINLYHKTEYFGVEHTKRFIKYLDRVSRELGEERAAQLIHDIRQVKQAAKDFAKDPETVAINKAKKVWSFIIEALFTYLFPPQRIAELSNRICSFKLSSFPKVRSDSDYNFPIQVIDENLSLKDVLDAGWDIGLLHKKNWKTLIAALKQVE